LEKYLFECVDSIAAQTLPVDEVIVVHDGCKDPKMCTNSDHYIREKNKGVAISRKEGFHLSTGDYILFVDADDVLPENFIEQMKLTLDKRNCDVAYPSVLLWSRWGDEAPLDNAWYEPSSNITLKEMKKMNEVVVTSMMKREVYETTGDFNSTLEIFEDYDFWVRALIKKFKFKKANTFLKYRQRVLGRNQANQELKIKVAKQITDRYKDAFK
jgi:glycosyltransferase involved in cell wall biosynthesis